MKRNEVYAALDSERDYQDMRIKRDGTTAPAEHSHTPEEFLLYIEHYVSEARRVASTTWGPQCKPAVMDILRKVGALVVAAGEGNGMPQREGFERLSDDKIPSPEWLERELNDDEIPF